MIQEQHFEDVSVDDVYGTVEKMQAEGYRMVQICGVTMTGASQLIYSFDKDMELRNLKVLVPFGTSVKSITPIYWAAFIYENEVHDLFDIEFTDSQLDYKGNFFKLSKKNPWKGPEADNAKEAE